jgi:hypothetical protein
MEAAAHGKSNVGIPKKVAREFVAADPGGKLPKSAAAPKPKFGMAEIGRKSKPK